jgi:hypothetical protein
MQTIVMGGTPELRMVFELTKESPQKRTVPPTASKGSVRLFTGGSVGGDMMKPHAIRNPPLRQRSRRNSRFYSSLSFFSFGEMTMRQYPALPCVL